MTLSALLAGPAVQAAADGHEGIKVLYASKGTDSGVGTISQDVHDGSAPSTAADDFVVPGGKRWKINAVSVDGAYFNGNGPADSVSITIYRADHKTVGDVVVRYPDVPVRDQNGQFWIRPPVTTLEPGAYYLSVVANMRPVGRGEWHWKNMVEEHGRAPKWQRPDGDGPCQRWTKETKCFGPGTGDHFFVLRGRVERFESSRLRQ